MSTTFALRLLPLAPLALLLACTESRELPSAPSITAHRSATDGSDAPAPRGYTLMVHDPVKDRLYLFGGFSRFESVLALRRTLRTLRTLRTMRTSRTSRTKLTS